MYIGWLKRVLSISINRLAMPTVLCQMLAQRRHTTTFGSHGARGKEVNAFRAAFAQSARKSLSGKQKRPRPERLALVDINLRAPVPPGNAFIGGHRRQCAAAGDVKRGPDRRATSAPFIGSGSSSVQAKRARLPGSSRRVADQPSRRRVARLLPIGVHIAAGD